MTMKISTKKMTIAGLSAFVLIIGAGIATSFAAQGKIITFSDRITNEIVHFEEGRENLINAIAEKFSLNVTDVEAVFNEHREEMFADREVYFTQRVNEQVTNSELTQAQADALIAKRAELIDFAKTLEGKSPEEIQQIVQEQMESLKVWAQENDITLKDLRALHLGFGPMHGSMHGHGKMMRGF